MLLARKASYLIALSLLFHAGQASASLVHDYELNNSLADALGGPSLVNNGATLGANGLTFGANQGPSLSNALSNTGVYSIQIGVSIDSIIGDRNNGYVKLIDFNDRTSDLGFYNRSGHLNFYNFTEGPLTPITAGTEFDALLTRDAAGNVSGYFNGNLQFTFLDSSGAAIFSAANDIIHFLRDDSVTGFQESTSGFLDYIRIYDSAITPGSTVPEPSSMALLGLGGLGLAVAAYRRRKA